MVEKFLQKVLYCEYFLFTYDPIIAAHWHMDKHVVKMILEYSQIMCTAHHVLGSPISNDNLYRKTHENHPSSIWVRQGKENYLWLYKLFCAVCDEYKYRYCKTHKTDVKLREILCVVPFNIPQACFTSPPQAMPDDCKCEHAIRAYRQYYIRHKSHIAKWKERNRPYWYVNKNTIDNTI